MTANSLQTREESPAERTYADVRPLPASLDSPRSKLVYLYLRSIEGGTIDDLRTDLGMKAISLYPVLETLDEKGLVDRDGERVALRST